MQYENQVIEKIDISVENLASGANFDNRSVLQRLKTREGDMFSHIDFDNDLKMLAQDFDRVIPQLESINGKLYIALRIWPKPIIRGINYRGNCNIKSSKLQKELSIPSGSVFDRQAFNKAFHKLKAYYVKQGFFEAEIEYKIIPDPNCNEVEIDICVTEGRAGKIKNIIFDGFSKKEEDELLDMIFTKKYNFVTSWFTNEGTYNEEAVQQDQFTILNYIQNEGYADARVKIEVKEALQKNRIVLIIHLDRGPQYFFGKITLEGNKLFSWEQLEPHFDIYPGKPFSPDRIRDTLRNITNYYGKRGYIDAIVDFEPTEDCENHLYNLHITVDEGERFNVGLIKVFGNCSTQTRVILHETLLVPGEVFNSEKLQATEERLQNIGYFKNVNVYAVKSEEVSSLGGNYRDVHIEVEETNTGYFSASGGFSNTENLFIGFNVTEKNFNYKGLGCVWNEGLKVLRGGGEYFHSNITFGSKSRKYELGWTKPYFMDTQWIVGFDIENTSTRYISHDYDIDATGLTLHTAYQANPFLRVGWHYRIRNSHIDLHDHRRKKKETKILAMPEGKKKTKKLNKFNSHRDGIDQLKKQAEHQGLVSAVGTTLYYDSTDNPTCPTEGFRSRLTAEMAGVGGYHSFFGLGYLNTYYYPLHRRGVLKFRADCRFLVPYGKTDSEKIPLDERLFLGGDTFIRGYRQYRLGPQFTKDDPKGGTSLQYLSLEYDRKLFKRADFFVFFDAGALTGRVFDFGRLNMSMGYGLRMKVLDSIPPITVGMGYPLNPKKNSDVQKFFFQFGGHF
jgi:outer membrane protein insertion porin family